MKEAVMATKYSVGKSSYGDLSGEEQFVATQEIADQVASLCYEFDTQVAKNGDHLTVNEGIRSRARQSKLYAAWVKFKRDGTPYANLAANPYTSTHDESRGSALDFGITDKEGKNRALTDPEFDWLHRNGPRRGIHWTGAGFARVEQWHHNGGYAAALPPITNVRRPGTEPPAPDIAPLAFTQEAKPLMKIIHSPKGHTLVTEKGTYKFDPIKVDKETFLGSYQVALMQRVINADQSNVLDKAPEFNDVQVALIAAIIKKAK